MSKIFQLPQMSITMLEGVVVKWLKSEGDYVEKNEPLCEVETDKLVTEITAPWAGYLNKIFAAEGETIPIGADMCELSEQRETSAEETTVDLAVEPEKSAAAATFPTTAPVKAAGGRRLISPLAAKMAASKGIEISEIEGTGPRGMISEADVLRAQEAHKAVPATATAESEPRAVHIPLRGVRKRTAEHMMSSQKNTATLTTFVQANMGNVARMREFVKVSYTAYVVKAAAIALKEFPALNSELRGEEILQFTDVNVNVAVDADGSLLTPVVRGAAEMTLPEIGKCIVELANKARNKGLTLDDFKGGTFTVTNAGVFGSIFSTPIINYPQCAILAMGKTVKAPVVREDEIVIAPIMNLSLSYDHRIVDGSSAVQFVVRIKELLESPTALME